MSRPRRMRYGTGACWLAVAVMLTVLAEISEGKEMTCEDADELARQLKDEGRLEEAKAALLQLLEVCPEEAGECGRTDGVFAVLSSNTMPDSLMFPSAGRYNDLGQ
eukprot:1959443-Rhodomonas_salina.2